LVDGSIREFRKLSRTRRIQNRVLGPITNALSEIEPEVGLSQICCRGRVRNYGHVLHYTRSADKPFARTKIYGDVRGFRNEVRVYFELKPNNDFLSTHLPDALAYSTGEVELPWLTLEEIEQGLRGVDDLTRDVFVLDWISRPTNGTDMWELVPVFNPDDYRYQLNEAILSGERFRLMALVKLMLDRQKSGCQNRESVCSAIESELGRGFWQWLVNGVPQALQHGNLNAGHLLACSKRKTIQLVDWETAFIGPRLFDLAVYLAVTNATEQRLDRLVNDARQRLNPDEHEITLLAVMFLICLLASRSRLAGRYTGIEPIDGFRQVLSMV
jgi:hypothetical protein